MTREEILKLEAGRELDALVAEKVMDKDISMYKTGDGFTRSWTDGYMCEDTFYSTDIAAAWEVVEHFTGEDCRNQDFFIECWSDGEWFVAFYPMGYSSRDPKASCDGRTTGKPSAPLAICRAALLAVMELQS